MGSLLIQKSNTMIQTEVYTEHQMPDNERRDSIVKFLFENLEQYGDKPEDISRAIDFSLKLRDSFGGFVLVSSEEDEIVGAVVVNATGMLGYIPENILVYIATHKEQAGNGYRQTPDGESNWLGGRRYRPSCRTRQSGTSSV